MFTASAIPWPVGVTPAGQDSSWSIYQSYGNFHGTGSWEGINNIDEKCWQTDSDNQFSGVTTNPVLAAFPDGPYRIDVTSYAWDTTVTNPVQLDIELHNFSPVVEEVVISCEGRTIWQAYWTADELTPEWYNPVDLALLPDQELDITVVFSEPMDTTSVTVTAGVSSPHNDITASDPETIILLLLKINEVPYSLYSPISFSDYLL